MALRFHIPLINQRVEALQHRLPADAQLPDGPPDDTGTLSIQLAQQECGNLGGFSVCHDPRRKYTRAAAD